MAELVLQSPHVRIGGTTAGYVNLTGKVRAVTINHTAEQHDVTASQSSGRKRINGLKNWTATIEFNQDFAASNPDATLFPLVGQTTAISLAVRISTSASTGINPTYKGQCHLDSYSPVSQTIGDLMTVSIPVTGHGVLLRQTTAT